MPYNCNYLYPFSVHSDLSGLMQSCSVRWAHIHCIRSVMYSIIYLYKQNLKNVLSKLQILASRATIGVHVPFLLSSIFLNNWF